MNDILEYRNKEGGALKHATTSPPMTMGQRTLCLQCSRIADTLIRKLGRLPSFSYFHTINTRRDAYQSMQKPVSQFSRCERALSSVSFYM